MAIHCSALGATWPRSTTISVSTSTPLCRCMVSSSSGCRSKDNTNATRPRRRGDRVKRREFITLFGGAATWPLAAAAQQPGSMRRVGVITGTGVDADDADMKVRFGAFAQALERLGWSQGRNVQIDYRFGSGNPENIRRHAVELAALAPDVILSSGAASVGPTLQATRTIPVVFVSVVDPVGAGFADSMAQPGGNATGFVMLEYSMTAKYLELLKEIAPSVTRVAVLRDAAISAGTGRFGATLRAAIPPSSRLPLGDSTRATHINLEKERKLEA